MEQTKVMLDQMEQMMEQAKSEIMERTKKVEVEWSKPMTTKFTMPKSNRIFIGIDNGVTGGITILSESGFVHLHIKTPVKNCLNYTKKKAFHNRIIYKELYDILFDNIANDVPFCMIERSMVNPMRFQASVSAIRCLEATEIILEELQIPYQFIDSKEWQKALLPSGLQKEELKKAASSVAHRLFPKLDIVNADSLLIAEYCRRTKK